jgi:hypothetical protein
MNTRPSLYRTTLVAAALAAGCLGVAAAASAHEHWDHGRDGDRHGYATRHGWHERGERHGGGYYRPAPAWRSYYREPERYYERGYVVPEAYYGPAYEEEPPVVIYRPGARAEVVYGDPNVSLMIHLPL